MACIEKIYSVSALVGTGACNGNCPFCAGEYLRSEAALADINYLRSLESAIKLCARYGGWSLSLTGSGEPTCDPGHVTQALEVYAKCASQGAYFPNVNLFTNGIMLGVRSFTSEWLCLWKSLGLTNVVVSIHAPTETGQAKAYDLPGYPSFKTIFKNIRDEGLGVRCTLLLRKGGIDNAAKYQEALYSLFDLGVDNITSWCIGNPDGSRNEFTPSRLGLWSIRHWLWRNAKLCHGHVWGGGVYDYQGRIVRLTDYVTKHSPRNDFVRQLVVFQDGTVAYSWVREGALCMK